MEPDDHAAAFMIEFDEDIVGEWYVMAVRGRADALTCSQLQSRLCEVVERHKQVAVNFARVDYISSCGLRALLHAAREAQRRKVRFAVCSPSASVRKVFDISRLDEILEIHGELPC
jgi:anti-anti-sigma factor